MKNLEVILIAIIILNGCQLKSKETMNKKEQDPLEIEKDDHSLPEITINKDDQINKKHHNSAQCSSYISSFIGDIFFSFI